MNAMKEKFYQDSLLIKDQGPQKENSLKEQHLVKLSINYSLVSMWFLTTNI